jgi:hypothetical protein
MQAGLDGFRLAEERRQGAFAGQIAASDQVRAWAGLPTTGGVTLYYGGLSSATFAGTGPLADLDYAYAFGGPVVSGYLRERAWFGPTRTVFEPWPYVPGDIYGYRFVQPVRQPVGQWQGQTGPNRWESHPIYDPPVPAITPQPAVESPLLDGTPYATEQVTPPPGLPRRESREH